MEFQDFQNLRGSNIKFGDFHDFHKSLMECKKNKIVFCDSDVGILYFYDFHDSLVEF